MCTKKNANFLTFHESSYLLKKKHNNGFIIVPIYLDTISSPKNTINNQNRTLFFRTQTSFTSNPNKNPTEPRYDHPQKGAREDEGLGKASPVSWHQKKIVGKSRGDGYKWG